MDTRAQRERSTSQGCGRGALRPRWPCRGAALEYKPPDLAHSPPRSLLPGPPTSQVQTEARGKAAHGRSPRGQRGKRWRGIWRGGRKVSGSKLKPWGSSHSAASWSRQGRPEPRCGLKRPPWGSVPSLPAVPAFPWLWGHLISCVRFLSASSNYSGPSYRQPNLGLRKVAL